MKIGCVNKWGGRAFQMQLSAKQNSRTMQMMTMTIVIMMWPDIHHTIQSTHRTFTTIDIHYTRLFILCNIRCPPMMIDKSIICFIYFFGLVFGVAGLWTILHMVGWISDVSNVLFYTWCGEYLVWWMSYFTHGVVNVIQSQVSGADKKSQRVNIFSAHHSRI